MFESAIRNAQYEWAGTAVINYHKNIGTAFDPIFASNLLDKMTLESASYVTLHKVALGKFPQYANAHEKYKQAIMLIGSAKETQHGTRYLNIQ